MNCSNATDTRPVPHAPARLRGVFTPNIVPLDERGRIDEDEYRRYIEWLLDSGVHGLYPNGSTGEFTRFSVAERRRIIQLTCEVAVPRGAPVLAGAAEANVEETLDACRAYYEMGATAVAIVSPIYYRLSGESIYAYFSTVAEHSPIDVTLYNIPMLASPIDLATVRRLAERYQRVVGIKDSSGDVAHMARLVNAIRPIRPDFCFLTGWDVVLLPMMLVGADGGTNATSGVAPELMRRLYDDAVAGLAGDPSRLKTAIALQMRLVELFDAMLSTSGLDFPEGFRTGVRLRGIRVGEGRQPLTNEQREKREKLATTLRCMLADLNVPGVTYPEGACEVRPLGGRDLYPGLKLSLSPSRSPGVDASTAQRQESEHALRVRQITDAVLATLQQRGKL